MNAGVPPELDAERQGAHRDEWDRHSTWWVDQFTDGADREYVEQILPLLAARLDPITHRRVVDIGCGEGQVSRLLLVAGHRVVGVEPSDVQRAVAAARTPVPELLAADATRLPCVDGTADAAILVLVLEHIESFDRALAEAVRVVRPGGRVIAAINHPIVQTPESGWIDDHTIDPPEQYWRVGRYLVETTSVEEVDKDVFLTFHFRPLHRYVNAMADLGMVLTEMLEPSPPPGFVADTPLYTGLATIPRLMMLTWDKPHDGRAAR